MFGLIEVFDNPNKENRSGGVFLNHINKWFVCIENYPLWL